MQLVAQEFCDNITITYKRLKERHLKEKKKLVHLIKQENEGRGLSGYLRGEDNRVSPTPRARPVCFNKGTEESLNIDNLDLFAMETFSTANKGINVHASFSTAR